MTPAAAVLADPLVSAPAPTASVSPGVAVPPPLQTSLTERATRATAVVVGLALLSGVLSTLVAAGYRWYVHERAPSGLPVLVGLSGVALSLNTSRALSQVITETAQPFDETTALFNVLAVLVSTATARAAIDVGDRIGSDVFVATGAREVGGDVSRMVQAVGRVITVEVPEEIDDIVGYDPVPEETKEKLGGRTFVFPRRLTVEELRERLVTRLKADYAVGHVDVELSDEGDVDYIALGSRAAGIGPTLPPETSGVAVRADPAFSAGPGDLVQVWRTDPPERLLTAEVRGVAGDVVTLAVDAADTRRLDDETEYKLVTLPVEKRADREFVSLFRAADETMTAVAVEAGSTLDGQPVDAMDVTVVAVRTVDGPVEPLPPRNRRLGGGETVYVVATPEGIRRVETAAAAGDPIDADAASGATLPPEHRVGPGAPVARDEPEAPPVTEETRAAGETTESAGSAAAGSEPAVTGATAEPNDGVTADDDDEDEPTQRRGSPDEVSGEDQGDEAAGDGTDEGDPDRDGLDELAGTDVDDLLGTDVSGLDDVPAEELPTSETTKDDGTETGGDDERERADGS